MENMCEVTIPAKNENYVPDQFFDDLKEIFESRTFYPIFITGLSGNGKTEGVLQAARAAGRPLVRVNFTIETDENDLIGGLRLESNEAGGTATTFEEGPVLQAMKAGAILLLDEIDLASPSKVMCLQSICEGKPYFIKKLLKEVEPAPGFTIVATANTKGRGSYDGRFVGTNILNEAFLERFSATFEQEYPSTKQETKILSNYMKDFGIDTSANLKYIDTLVKWAAQIRETYAKGGSDDVISTRRLIHILKAMRIFQNHPKPLHKAMDICLNRFDTEVKTSFLKTFELLLPYEPEENEDMDGLKAFESAEEFADFLNSNFKGA